MLESVLEERWKKQVKKKRRKLLAAILAAAMLVPQSILPASAADLSAAEPVYEVSGLEAADVQDVSASVERVSALEHGTVNIRYRMAAPNSGLTALYSVSDQSEGASYAAFYVNNSTVGLELRSGGSQLNTFTAANQDVNDTEWHTLTWVFGDTSTILYVDGAKAAEASTTAFFSSIAGADAMAIGGLLRSGTNWHHDLSISEISVYEEQFTAENVTEYVDAFDQTKADTAYEVRGVDLTAGAPQDVSEGLSDVAGLSNGTVNIRYRMNAADSGLTGLYSLSDRSTGTTDATYAAFYVNNNTVGLELRQANAHLNSFSASTYADGEAISINDTYWHTLTWVFGETDTKLYVDGKLAAASAKTEFFASLSDLDTMTLGGVIRDSVSGTWYHPCVIDEVSVYSEVFTAETVEKYHAATQWTAEPELDMENAYKSETIDLFYPGYKNSQYRIPSLLTTQEGTQLAFIDERNSGTQDAGNIDAVVRRKEAGETQFADSVTLIDLPNNGGSAAFTIDMATVQEQESGRIFAFVDMFPESSGLMNTNLIQPGVGYKKVDGADCQILYTNPEEKEEYGYISDVEDGIGHVLDNNGEDTGYTVIVYPYAAGVSLQEKGNLYKDGEYRGNIYMKSGPDAGELRVLNTSYLWLVTSDDDGKTWSDPVDITPQVKPEWCVFFGTGPGVGIQLHTGDHEGRLVVPVYTANKNVGSSQSSAVIYSDDNGQTWHLGESPQTVKGNDRATMNSGGMLTESQAVQLDNGDVLLFMRTNCSGSKVYVAVSKDGGATWASADTIEIKENYCQLSVIHYTKADGTEWVLLSNASGNGRMNGRMYLGQVQADGSIIWDYNREINGADEKFAYSCLTLTDSAADPENPKFAIMYEDDTDGSMRLKYFEFDENYLKAGTVTPEEMDAPQLVSHDVQIRGEGTAEIALTFDQVIMAAGEPQLTLTMGSEEITADYVSGSGTDTVVFTAAVPAGTVGILRLTGPDLENGMLENIQGMSPALTAMVLFANTEIDLAGTEVTYTTQHSSSTAENTDGAAVNVIDGNPATYWHSTWGNDEITLPQSVTLKLPEAKTIYKVDYLARQNSSSGRIKEYGIEVSTDGTEFTEAAHGMLADTKAWQEIEFVPVEAQYVRFVAYEAYSSGTESCSLAELKLHEYSDGVITPGNTEELQALADGAADLAEEDYSDVTWSVYAEALAAANAVLDSEMPASQSLIDRTADNLKDAQEALTDISRAAARFDEIRKQEAEYTPDSWAAFEAWMNENEPKLQEAESSREVTDLIAALVFRTGNLVEKADKEALRDLWTQYTVTDPLAEDGYDKESWEQYEQALGRAEEVLADENAAADEVAEAIQGLTDARTALKADMSELKTLYDLYSGWTTDQYLPNGAWDTLQDALGRAAEMLEAGTAAPADVKAMIGDLTAAAEDVEVRPDTGGLKALYESLTAELGDLSAYMSEGAEAMKTALENAEKVLNDPQTEQQVEDQKAALEEAYAGLVLKATEEQILEMTGLEESLGQKDLTGLSEEQLAQVKEIRDALWEAINADEISAEDAAELIEKAEEAMSLSGQEDEPQTPPEDEPLTPSEDKPADGKPSASDDKNDAGDQAVKTGDTAGYGWIILMLAAGTAAAASAVLRRQNRRA